MPDYELIRVQREVLEAAIPVEQRWMLHWMYEDNDLEGAYNAEEVAAALEHATPESIDALATNGTLDEMEDREELLTFLKKFPAPFVGILVNSCHSPGCNPAQEEHFHCELYDPYWETVIVPRAVWEQSRQQREEALGKFKEENGCRHAKTS